MKSPLRQLPLELRHPLLQLREAHHDGFAGRSAPARLPQGHTPVEQRGANRCRRERASRLPPCSARTPPGVFGQTLQCQTPLVQRRPLSDARRDRAARFVALHATMGHEPTTVKLEGGVCQ